jgi:hypothetical protein
MLSMRHATLFAAALVFALGCSAATVQWKWRDAAGRINASDMAPPASVPERDILQRPTDQPKRGSSPAAAPSAPATTVAVQGATAAKGTDPELEARRKRAADEKATAAQQEKERLAKARADNCMRARSQLAALNDGQRMSRATAQGEVIILDDRARAEETERTRAVIASDCG